jgi:hypothetical protein
MSTNCCVVHWVNVCVDAEIHPFLLAAECKLGAHDAAVARLPPCCALYSYSHYTFVTRAFSRLLAYFYVANRMWKLVVLRTCSKHLRNEFA